MYRIHMELHTYQYIYILYTLERLFFFGTSSLALSKGDMFSEGCHPIHSLAASIPWLLVGWDDLHTYVVRELSLSAGERGCVRVAQVTVLDEIGKVG